MKEESALVSSTFHLSNQNPQDITDLSRLLQEVHSPPAPSPAELAQQQQYPQQAGRCNYADFCRLREQVPEAARAHFTVQNFLKVCWMGGDGVGWGGSAI